MGLNAWWSSRSGRRRARGDVKGLAPSPLELFLMKRWRRFFGTLGDRFARDFGYSFNHSLDTHQHVHRPRRSVRPSTNQPTRPTTRSPETRSEPDPRPTQTRSIHATGPRPGTPQPPLALTCWPPPRRYSRPRLRWSNERPSRAAILFFAVRAAIMSADRKRMGGRRYEHLAPHSTVHHCLCSPPTTRTETPVCTSGSA